MHTPGPWTTEGEDVLAAGVPVALARNIDDTRATLDANARLIAAAPKLLEALERIAAKPSLAATSHVAEDAIREAKGE